MSVLVTICRKATAPLNLGAQLLNNTRKHKILRGFRLLGTVAFTVRVKVVRWHSVLSPSDVW
jgi:hypothetical protein